MLADVDDDNDGVEDVTDAFPTDASESKDQDLDGVGDNADAFPLDASETLDTDGDGVGDNADAFDLDASESVDTDGDGLGNNADLDDDDDTFTDEEELADGTDPLNRFSCKSGCFSFDVDENLEAQPLDRRSVGYPSSIWLQRRLINFWSSIGGCKQRAPQTPLRAI